MPRISSSGSTPKRRRRRTRTGLGLLVTCFAFAAAAASAGAETWVSGTGDDVNPCSRTAPCKTFAGAISKTTAGGTIGVLNPGGYGAVTITKAITIDAGGQYASILVSGTNGITVNAGAGHDVVLRGLTIFQVAPCTTAGTTHGIRFLSGRSLRIEDTTIAGFPGAGVDAEPTADGGTVTVSGSRLSDNCTAGLLARRAAGSVSALLSDSLVTTNATGVLAGAGATVRIARDTIATNTTGLTTEAAGTLGSFGDNHLAGNVTDGAPTVDLSPPVQTPAPTIVTTTVPGPTVTVTEPAPPPVARPAVPHCRVPNLAGKTLTQTRRALAAGHCAVGVVRYRVSSGRRANRVYRQTTTAGTFRAGGARIGVTINAPRAVKGPARGHAAIVGGPTRTWVSGTGDDANPCSRTAPCLTFAGAVSKTTDGGTISVLDPGEYGPLTITAPVTIDAGGQPATVTATAGTPAITIATPSSAAVTLRGLTLLSDGGCSAAGAGDGIHVTSGGVLHVEDVTTNGFPGAGVGLQPATDLRAVLSGVRVSNGCTAGVAVQPSGGATDVTIDRGELDRDGTGVIAGDGAHVRLAATSITNNAVALTTTGSGILQAWNDGRLAGNDATGATPGALALG